MRCRRSGSRPRASRPSSANPNTPAEAEQFVETATANDIPLVASILDATGPGEMAAILADPGPRADHVDAIVDFAADGDFAGIDLDYEQFAFADGRDTWATTRPNWVAFVAELAERLHADGRTLTVSVPPVYDARRTRQSGYWVYDYGAIAPLVDSIRVMAYDYSNASTDAGPIAPLEWVSRIIAGTTAAVGDPSKLVLGVPLYGYNWPTEESGDCDGAPGVTTVTGRTVDALANERGATPVHDPATGESSFTYELDVDGACTQTPAGELRRRRRDRAAHPARPRCRLRRGVAVRPRLRRRRGLGRRRRASTRR